MSYPIQHFHIRDTNTVNKIISFKSTKLNSCKTGTEKKLQGKKKSSKKNKTKQFNTINLLFMCQNM